MDEGHQQAVVDALNDKYEKCGKDFLVKSHNIAKQLNLSSYKVRDVLKQLEKERSLVRTDLSKTIMIWKTNIRETGPIRLKGEEKANLKKEMEAAIR